MGRFLTVLKSLGGTVSPPSLLRKSIYRAKCAAAMAAGVALLEWRCIMCIDIPAFKP
jgi:hypothetical protein